MAEVYLNGKIVGSISVSTTAKGTAMARGLIESELVRKIGRDEYRAETHQLPFVVFSWIADALRDLRPGTTVTLGCRLNGTRYEAPDGSVKHGCQLVVDQIAFPPTRKESA
jgi:single-stranded DNA-binding protein